MTVGAGPGMALACRANSFLYMPFISFLATRAALCTAPPSSYCQTINSVNVRCNPLRQDTLVLLPLLLHSLVCSAAIHHSASICEISATQGQIMPELPRGALPTAGQHMSPPGPL